MVTTPAEGFERLRAATADGRLDALCDRLGVELLVVFGSAARPPAGAPPNDLDVAVSLDDPGRLLELVDALLDLTDCDALDVAVLDRATPVLRARALTGVGLYERTPGLFAVSQMAALAEERDTKHLRDLDLRSLAS